MEKKFLERFGDLNGDALELINRVLNAKKEIILCDFDPDESYPDEFYELITQTLHIKCHTEIHKIWKLTLTPKGVVAHGIDIDNESEFEFHLDDGQLDWSTNIELAAELEHLDPDTYKIYEVSDIVWDTESLALLPDVVLIGVPVEIIGDENTENYISDQISEQYGWCHKGFSTYPELYY